MKKIFKKFKTENEWSEKLKHYWGSIKSKFVLFILSFILGTLGYFAWKFSYSFDIGFNILLKIAGFTTILGAFQGILELFPENKFRDYSILIIQLFIGLIKFVFEYGLMAMNVVGALGFIFFLQLGVLLKINEYLSPQFLNEDFIYFFSFLVTLLLLAYTGKKVIFGISKIFLLPQRRESWYPRFLAKYRKYLRRIDFRKWAFLIATLIYLITVIEGLINMNLINHEFWIQSKDVTLQAFLAFLAIDRFIVNFREDLI